jgi:hypothetical protein
MDWIYLSQDGDRWRALVNTVLNLRDPQNVGDFRVAERHEASQGLNCTEDVGNCFDVLSGRASEFFIRSSDLDFYHGVSCWKPDQGYLQTVATSQAIPGPKLLKAVNKLGNECAT